MPDRSHVRTLTVAGVQIEAEWTLENGAAATIPPQTVSSRMKEGVPEITPELVQDALQRFDDAMLIGRVDLAALGFAAVNRTESEFSPLDISFSAWAASVPLTFAEPIVIPTRRDTITGPSEMCWALGFAGMPIESAARYIPASDPIDIIVEQIQEHLSGNSETAQAELYLQNPERLARYHFDWATKEFEASLESSLIKKNHHVPYTRVRKILKEETIHGVYSIEVHSLDVSTDTSGVITPAVVVTYYKSTLESTQAQVQDVLSEDGLSEVHPESPPHLEGRSGNMSRRASEVEVYAKDPELFSSEAGKYWLERRLRGVLSGTSLNTRKA